MYIPSFNTYMILALECLYITSGYAYLQEGIVHEMCYVITFQLCSYYPNAKGISRMSKYDINVAQSTLESTDTLVPIQYADVTPLWASVVN